MAGVVPQGSFHSIAVIKNVGNKTAAIEGCKCGSIKPGTIIESLNCSLIEYSLLTSHGCSVSRVPASSIKPSLTATASARGIEGFTVITDLALKISIIFSA